MLEKHVVYVSDSLLFWASSRTAGGGRVFMKCAEFGDVS